MSRVGRLGGWAAIAIIVLTGIEATARLAEALFEPAMAIPAVARTVNARLNLDPYKIAAADHGAHWRLRPGYGADAARVLADKLAQGRVEGAAAIASADEGREAGLAINDQGFKGPAIDPGHTRRRVLVLGDSVTFGYPAIDYVRVFQSRLALRGIEVEAINGGVEGYGVRNHLLELDRYGALKPDVVMILLGWNDIFGMSRRDGDWSGHLAALRLWDQAARAFERLDRDAGSRATELRAKPKHMDPADPALHRMENAAPDLIERIERLALAQEAGGARVVIATLPGLYLPGQTPSPAALAKGHLPQWTDNPLALAAATGAANRGLRRLAAAHGWTLVDFAEWSRTALVPRDGYFVDSVHLTADGYRLMGNYLAESFRPQPGE